MFKMRTNINFKILVLNFVTTILEVSVINAKSNPFKDVVDSKYLVDKTILIKYFHRQNFSVFYTAPRMFGKTVNLFMLKTFYEINVDQSGSLVDKNTTQNHETFSKLSKKQKISDTIFEDQNFFYAQFGSLPVLHYSFENLTVCSINEFLKSFRAMTSSTFHDHNYLLNSDRLNSTDKNVMKSYLEPGQMSENELVASGRVLTSLLYKHFSKACLVLVDEFDAPVLKVITSQSEDEKDIFALLMQFSSDMLIENPGVMKAFLIGNTKLAKVYLPENVIHWQFTENEFMAPYFGFNEKEVEFLNRFTDLLLKDIRLYYDGYRGQNASMWVYNPHSISQLLETHKMDVYWSAAVPLDILSTLYKQHASVRDLIRSGCSIEEIKIEMPRYPLKYGKDIMTLKKMFSPSPMLQMNVLVEFLYELGYFTDKTIPRSCDEWSPVLITPNKEVASIFTQFFKKVSQK